MFELALTLRECQCPNTLATKVPQASSVRYHFRKRSNVSVTIKPLEDRIVIKQVEAEQTTASGLVIPDSAKEKPQEGSVVAVGPKAEGVAVGDTVIYSKYGGTEVKYGGEEFLILKLADVLAVVER